MAEADVLEKQSRKLNVVIGLLLRVLLKDEDFTQRKRKGTGELAVYLKRHGLEYPRHCGYTRFPSRKRARVGRPEQPKKEAVIVRVLVNPLRLKP
ncbi:MAG TPA: hypothetical protein VG206_03810 [Terriglobia bacterium]|nr:hypothetical protein [Terriglobia bacterium]